MVYRTGYSRRVLRRGDSIQSWYVEPAHRQRLRAGGLLYSESSDTHHPSRWADAWTAHVMYCRAMLWALLLSRNGRVQRVKGLYGPNKLKHTPTYTENGTAYYV